MPRLKLYMPWNNLGCLGLRIGSFYIDMFTDPFGIFFNTGRTKVWIFPRLGCWRIRKESWKDYRCDGER